MRLYDRTLASRLVLPNSNEHLFPEGHDLPFMRVQLIPVCHDIVRPMAAYDIFIGG